MFVCFFLIGITHIVNVTVDVRHYFEDNDITLKQLQEFLNALNEVGLSATSQARIVSGIKAFYSYLVLENLIQNNI